MSKLLESKDNTRISRLVCPYLCLLRSPENFFYQLEIVKVGNIRLEGSV